MTHDKSNPYKEHKLLTALAAVGVVALVVCAYLLLRSLMGEEAAPGGARPVVAQIKARRVVNGHYVKLAHDEKLIYAGIRAPYENEPLFEDAKKRNEAMVVDQELTLHYDSEQRDSDGRLLAYAFLGDGTHVNLTLVREGLAYVRLTPKAKRYADLLLAAQTEARLNQRGLWARMVESTETNLSGDSKYGEFHRPTCESAQKISDERRVLFPTKRAAFEKGFAPCNRCLP